MHGGRDMQRRRGLLDPVMPGLAEQCFLLGQGLNHLLHEKGVALGLLEDEQFEGHESGIIAQQGSEQSLGFDLAQGIQPQLGVVASVAPARLILGPVVHEEENPPACHAVDEKREESLGLAVEPLQVLEQEFDGLVEALAHQQSLDCLESALAPDLGVHVRQCRTRRADPQQIEQVGQQVFQTALQVQHLAGDLLAAPSLIVLGGDLKIVLQEFDQRQIGKGFAVRNREGLQHQTASL